jgi:transcriptional regulator of arginine metabolism
VQSCLLGTGEKVANIYAPAMQALAKAERQRLLSGIVARKRVGTQLELARALAGAGCEVTQATVSRDIRELGLEKTHDPLGRPRYELPADAGRRRHDPQQALVSVLAQFGRRTTAAQNLVVVHSELGSAPAIARAIDRTEHPRVVATLAGDDTCLVVTRDEKDARALAAQLAEALR